MTTERVKIKVMPSPQAADISQEDIRLASKITVNKEEGTTREDTKRVIILLPERVIRSHSLNLPLINTSTRIPAAHLRKGRQAAEPLLITAESIRVETINTDIR